MFCSTESLNTCKQPLTLPFGGGKSKTEANVWLWKGEIAHCNEGSSKTVLCPPPHLFTLLFPTREKSTIHTFEKERLNKCEPFFGTNWWQCYAMRPFLLSEPFLLPWPCFSDPVNLIQGYHRAIWKSGNKLSSSLGAWKSPSEICSMLGDFSSLK